MSDEQHNLPNSSTGNFLKYIGYILAVIMPATYLVIQMYFPQLLTHEADKSYINKELKKDEQNMEIRLRAYGDSLMHVAKAYHSVMVAREKANQQEIAKLNEQLASYQMLIEGLQRQTNFNTYHNSTNGEAIFQLMEDDKKARRVKHTGITINKWVYWEGEWYDYPQLHPLRVVGGRELQGAIYPFERGKIKLRFKER